MIRLQAVLQILLTHISAGIYTANLMVSNDVSTDFMLKKITVVQAAAPVPDFTSDCTTDPDL